ncbi:unnamed protein product [Rotaria magnacalcarata]|uniref:Uncharacterized protein n=2 Tax=Rotaria magnacalcarata TaxID=392030 RepID=A0A814Z8R5_9BILA|nr:unnamed protein product [Rotaria magnacalcarata]CAF1634953.1 unnamed protein product [Rotaria magnacalcarata]CAF4634439.1 unnamed protein product [Rotaria magnacalcarata]
MKLIFNQNYEFETTIILHGHELKQRFKTFSSKIRKLISGDGNDDENELEHYQQLFKSIKLITTTFNINFNAPAIVGECGFDCIVEWIPDDEVIVIIQHVNNLHKWNIITGVMVMRLSNENSSFTVDQIVKTTSKRNYLNSAHRFV